VVMPFDFLRLIWVSVLGYLFFREIPDLYVWIGGAIIFTSGFYLAWRENRARQDRNAVERAEKRAAAAVPSRSGLPPASAGQLGDQPEGRRADQAG